MPVAKSSDYVYPLKYESSASGGTEDDLVSTEIDASEDGLVAHEFAIPSTIEDPHTDAIQQGMRVDPVTHELLLRDSTAGEKKLSDLAAGSSATTVNIVTADYDILSTNIIVLANGSSDITITLPAVTDALKYYIKNISTYEVVVATADSATIDENASITMKHKYEAVTVVCDGSNWWIV